MNKINVLLIIFLALTGCAGLTHGEKIRQSYPILSGIPSDIIVGKASWYGKRFHGRKTANGEKYNMHAMTAAHRWLPFGSLLKVTNLANDKQLIVRVNDRGPFVRNRILDLSFAAAESLDMLHQGVSTVKIEVYPPASSSADSGTLASARRLH